MASTFREEDRETSQEKKEKLLVALKKKRECETRALSVVHRLVEPENPVDPAWLLDSAKHISRGHYKDATEERALIFICGYPLCQNRLANVPKKKYHISVASGKVYDIEERKNFCSNKCYGASLFFQKQLLTSPLWMRSSEEIPQFRLQDPTSARGIVGEDVFVHLFAKPDPEEPERPEKPKAVEKPSQSEEPQIAEIETKLAKVSVNPPKTAKPAEPEKSRPVVSTPDIAWNAVQHWVTLETVRLLLGDEKVESANLPKAPQVQTLNSDPRYLSLCKRLDVQEAHDAVFDRHLTVTDQNSALRPVPSYEQLKRDFEQAEVRVRAFYAGKPAVDPPVEEKAKPETPGKGQEEGFDVVLPPVDAHAQKLLRRRIVSGQLDRIIPDLAQTLNLSYNEMRQDVKETVSTFSFSADNITFKPDEWSLVGLLIIRLVSLKNESVQKGLQSPTSERFTQLMLLGTGAPRGFLDNFVLWFSNDAVHTVKVKSTEKK